MSTPRSSPTSSEQQAVSAADAAAGVRARPINPMIAARAAVYESPIRHISPPPSLISHAQRVVMPAQNPIGSAAATSSAVTAEEAERGLISETESENHGADLESLDTTRRASEQYGLSRNVTQRVSTREYEEPLMSERVEQLESKLHDMKNMLDATRQQQADMETHIMQSFNEMMMQLNQDRQARMQFQEQLQKQYVIGARASREYGREREVQAARTAMPASRLFTQQQQQQQPLFEQVEQQQPKSEEYARAAAIDTGFHAAEQQQIELENPGISLSDIPLSSIIANKAFFGKPPTMPVFFFFE